MLSVGEGWGCKQGDQDGARWGADGSVTSEKDKEGKGPEDGGEAGVPSRENKYKDSEFWEQRRLVFNRFFWNTGLNIE